MILIVIAPRFLAIPDAYYKPALFQIYISIIQLFINQYWAQICEEIALDGYKRYVTLDEAKSVVNDQT